MRQAKERHIYLIYILTCFLFLEWLYPTKKVLLLGSLHLFIIFSVICYLLYYFHIHLILTIFIKAISSVFIIFTIFSEENELFGKWLLSFMDVVMKNSHVLIKGDWGKLSYEYLSFLLLLAIWFITYLLHFMIIKHKRPMLFFILSIVYIGCMDAFSDWDGKHAIIRVIFIGYFLLSFTSVQRILRFENIRIPKKIWSNWFIFSLSIISIGVIIGVLGPKYAPHWPNTIIIFETQAKKITGIKQEATLGYREDDRRLGGSFKRNSDIVFEVESPSKQYWKVEVRDIYTGHGWESIDDEEWEKRFYSDEWIPKDDIYMNPSEVEYAHFSMHLQYPHIIQPYFSSRIIAETEGHFNYLEEEDKIQSYDWYGEPLILDKYTVEYYTNQYDVEQLRNSHTVIDQDQLKKYTQLPDHLPQRVIDLAYDIVVDENNWYDQAKAIEQYFQSNEFSYDHRRVPFPEEDEDYVDQFLFETKRGYCDNYSTSMIALLRAIGIPSRWAKGYTGGTYAQEGENGSSVYEVTNNEAHSWVEVYFPTDGWVPFEPTKGFQSHVDFVEEASDEEVIQPEEQAEILEIEEEQQEVEEVEVSNDSTEMKIENKQTNDKEVDWRIIGIILLLFILLFLFLIYKRRKWLPLIWINIYLNKQDAATYISAYNILLKQLAMIGLKKFEGETLRAYATRVDQALGSTEMSQLTNTYERIIYRDTLFEEDWSNHKVEWEYLMRQIMKS